MPLLGGLLVTLFSGLTGWLATWFTKKIAIGLSAVAIFGGIVGVLLGVMRTAVDVLVSTLPQDSYILMGASMVFPPIASTCLLTIATTWAACTLYAWQRDALDLYVKAG